MPLSAVTKFEELSELLHASLPVNVFFVVCHQVFCNDRLLALVAHAQFPSVFEGASLRLCHSCHKWSGTKTISGGNICITGFTNSAVYLFQSSKL